LGRPARGGGASGTAGYLLGMPLLSDYLDEALSQFGQSCNA
jgi:hypothetical protein